MTLLDTGVDSVFAHRVDWEDATIVCVHELAGKPAQVTLPVEDGEALVDLFEHADCDLPATLQLEPFAARWFRIARSGVRLPP
jgi:maltose alpha-D-glucosyltransferase/alpha-amylase